MKKWPGPLQVILTGVALLAAGSALAQTDANGLNKALARENLKAQKNHSAARQNKSAVVSLSFDWEKPVYLSDMVRRRRAGFKDTLVSVKRKTTRCKGVLLERDLAVTPARCARGKDGFKLKQVNLSFANGKKGVEAGQSVCVKGKFAQIRVAPALTEGLNGVQPAGVPDGRSLKETFGSGISGELYGFFMDRGVVSQRAGRLTGVKNTLQMGEPFFYEGKLLALVSEVPSRLPVSLFGGVSEDALAVFDAHSVNLLLKK